MAAGLLTDVDDKLPVRRTIVAHVASATAHARSLPIVAAVDVRSRPAQTPRSGQPPSLPGYSNSISIAWPIPPATHIDSMP